MPKLNILGIILPLIGLMFTFILMLVYITQAQIISFLDLYSTMDLEWVNERVAMYLSVSLISFITAVHYSRKFRDGFNAKCIVWVLLALITGMLLGLAVYYASSCCDTPVVFHFGFPFSYLLGITGAQHYLPTTETRYLIQNIKNFSWLVIYWNLLTNIIFWCNVGFFLYLIRKTGWMHSDRITC